MKLGTSNLIPLQGVLLAAFAVVLGDFSYRVWNPPSVPEYMVAAEVRPMSLESDSPRKHLYLRRTWYMTEAPDRAWLEVLGHDRVEVFVNGINVGRSPMVSQDRIGAVMNDITQLLHVGRNSIAIHAPQLQLDRAPEIAVAGECEFADGTMLSLGDATDWKASDVYDRRGEYWYETDFADDHWSAPRLGELVTWRAQVNLPPRSVSEPRRSQWILPAETSDGTAAVARSFEIDGAPREGWLRAMATGPFRVAINGWLIVDDSEDLAVKIPNRALERTVDISPMLQSGTNTISIFATTRGEVPRIRADLEATAHNGATTYIATDGSWQSAAGGAANWLAPDLADAAWKACQPEVGYMGVVPRIIERQLVEVNPPTSFEFTGWLTYLCWMGFWGVAAFFGCKGTCSVLEQIDAPGIAYADQLPQIALLPSTVLALAGGLMTYDLKWSGRDVYQPAILLALVLLVVAQWLLLLLIGTWKHGRPAFAQNFELRRWPSFDRWVVVACWIALFAAALWLRSRDIIAEPIHHDEVTAYAFTEGVLSHGFPGGQVDPEIPFGYCATNELTYYFTALCMPFFDDPRLVLRVPSVFFSMATLALVAYVGWRWFNGYVGFVAAVLFTFSPHIIGMANFGRYLSQVQFFTLLTMYLTYEAVRGTGPMRLGMMWAATASFAAMYLSWEGTGMFGLGLALAVLFHRRKHLRSIFACPQFYAAVMVLVIIVVGQNAHRVMQQTQRLWYGEGISSLTIKPMWRYPFFQYDFYLVNSAWTRDALLPMIAVGVACVLAVAHRWRFPLRFSLICFLSNAFIMAALLPVRTNRYSFHLTAIFLLITAAVLVAGIATFTRLIRHELLPAAYGWYLRTVALFVAAVALLVTCGWFVRMSEMPRFANSAFDVRQLRIPDWEGPTQYLKQHLESDDVVISIYPHSQDYMFAVHQLGDSEPRRTDYWLESRLILQATLGDSREIPLDRRSGADMLYDLDQVKQLFANHQRVWYCTMRTAQSKINDSEVSKYLRDNMDVVFEDYGTALMLRDKNHRTAPIQLEDEAAGKLASEFYLK
jgi:hypothetical protein